MLTNYFEKLVKYTRNVYKIDRGFNKMKDGRVNPTHETSTVLLVILFGLFLRLRSRQGMGFWGNEVKLY